MASLAVCRVFACTQAQDDHLGPHTFQERTAYAVCLRLPGNDRRQYAGRRLHTWTDNPKDALRFDSMSAATIAAIEVLQLGPEDFTVEAI